MHQWLVRETGIYRNIATSLLARIEPLLTALRASLPEGERERLFARVDASHIVKSPDSILEKMARSWSGPETPPKVGFHNLDQLKDLGRFRIAANFLGDVEAITRHLADPYNATKAEGLTPEQRRLRDEFQLHDNQFENLISVLPYQRTSGERCMKGWFSPRQAGLRGYRVEVQLLTLSQESWDKKEHCLLYEPARRREPVPEHHRILCTELSATLWLVDLQFDQLRREAQALRAKRTSAPSDKSQEVPHAPAQ
ncbi:hypothetical protein [Pyxidicoccus caerfyrddinensis]|uniref:hypothetical protein n=1 Tax=Pyxidicoccus caerfyrddinensis TaxID=2709663 RepID=UPI001967358A|nr:hypothetical protein [Pyxidicoccus caerfyrddinensis]